MTFIGMFRRCVSIAMIRRDSRTYMVDPRERMIIEEID